MPPGSGWLQLDPPDFDALSLYYSTGRFFTMLLIASTRRHALSPRRSRPSAVLTAAYNTGHVRFINLLTSLLDFVNDVM